MKVREIHFLKNSLCESRTVVKSMNLEEMNVVEILDRVLDNGIVVAPSARMFLIGQELHAMNGRIVVESVRTFR